MKKNLVTALLLAFVVTSMGFWGVKAYIDSKKADSVVSKIRTVYYFHGNKRCRTCNNMENYTREAVNKYWPKLIKDGSLIFLSVNLDKAENGHFVKDFDMQSKAVVLTQPGDDGKIKFKKLNKVWEHVRNKDGFIQYIQSETRVFFNLR